RSNLDHAIFLHRRKKGLSLLISTLLLVVMVVAGAALIYAYMVGFIGSTTHVPASIQITGFCASATTKCGGDIYTVTINNIGSSPISGAFSLTFVDSTNSLGTGSVSCGNSNLAVGVTLTCSGPTTNWGPTGANIFSSNPTAGDQITVTVVSADGGTAITVTRATA
ncbi:MAG: archaellin/type IV pilin N-terminal domain-containing protein, partial [Nitrososphaerales archaeon]